jgi:putative membrane protein
VILVFGARDESAFIAPMAFPVVLAVLLALALWRQWTFRYGFGPRGLVIHEGLAFRNVRQIEYGRIENIDSQRGLLHRLLGVAEVSVQTSTGGKAEAVIRVLDLQAVRDMREHVFGESPAPSADAPRATVAPLLHLPIGELVRCGLIDNRGMIIVAALGGLFYEMGLFDVDRDMIGMWLQSSSIIALKALSLALQIGLALGVVVSALIAARLLSVIVAVVTLHDFTLTRSDHDLKVQYGLLTRVALTLRTPRIQAVHQTQTLLHRWFGRVSLDVDLTGDRGGNANERNQSRSSTRWLAPLCRDSEASALIAAALPALELSKEPAWQPLALGARARVFRRMVSLWVVTTVVLFAWLRDEHALLVLVFGLPSSWLHAHLYVKHTRWALLPEALLHRRGWLTRRLTVVPRDRIQSVALSSSPFDRRKHMASVTVDTAGGTRGNEVRIRYLEAGTAGALTRALYRGGAPSSIAVDGPGA